MRRWDLDFSTEDQMCEGRRTEEAKAVAQIEQTRKDEMKTRAQRGVWSLQFIDFFFFSVSEDICTSRVFHRK